VAGGPFGGMLKTDGGPAVEIGAGERDPTVVCALDFDVVEDGEGGASVEDFAQAGEGGFEFRHRERDGFHDVVEWMG
jgi:hypothetical protein